MSTSKKVARSAQWRGAKGVAAGRGVIVESANGGWAVSDEGATPDGYLKLDSYGAPSVDDSDSSGAARIAVLAGFLRGVD